MALSTYLSFFSGAGGLDLAVRLAVPEARCIGYVEIELPAAAILAALAFLVLLRRTER